MTQEPTFAGRLGGDLRLLFQSAIVIFLVTVIIGILNGVDAVDFSHDALLTHVHAGTLGWITLAVFATTFWLFSEGEALSAREAAQAHQLSLAAIGAMALYVLAFATGNGIFRPLAGTLALLVIVGVYAWAVAMARRVTLTVPRLAMLAALTTLLVGAVLGVLLGLKIAGRLDAMPVGTSGAHPASMVIGYLILAGIAIAEWRLRAGEPAVRAGRLGVTQVVLVFLAGLAIMLGLLFEVVPLNILSLPLELAGVGIFLGRLRHRLPRVSWSAGTDRQFGAAIGFLLLNIVLLTYLIGRYADDTDSIPTWLLFAIDHSMFVGVLTNSLLGLVLVATAARRSLWPWADQVAFWGVNVGLVGFVVGLILESTALKHTFTPILGLSLLVVMLTVSLRMATVRAEFLRVPDRQRD
jgi:hypothetical protein